MKAADWVLSQPWAITEEALGVILAIAERRNESPEAVEARLGRPLDNTRKVTTRDGVAIIPVAGPISRYADFFSEISGATAIDTLAKDFRTALDDRSVKAVILDMDTPGGTVAGVGEFAQHVAEARGKGKPVVAYVGNQAASAGYWIASAADAIVAAPTATLGSIGVVMGMRVPADPKAGQARTVEFVSSQSPHKRPDPQTEAGRAQVQATADDLADVFIDAVAANRGISRDDVLADFGRGGVLVGARAVAAGMADRLGSLEPLIAELARGECPARKKSVPARKAESTPRRAAMGEPNETTEPVMSAAEAAELRSRLAEAERVAAESRQSEAAAVRARIEAVASSYAGEVINANRALPSERQAILDAMTFAATDDHAHPVAGRPQARQDAVRAIYAARTPHTITTPKVSGKDSELEELPREPADPAGADQAAREERRRQNLDWKAQQGASVG
jgi:signal peptide peptidase SppA